MRHLVAAIARVSTLRLKVWLPPGELPPQVAAVMTPRESSWLGSTLEAGGIANIIRSGGFRSVLAPIRLLGFLRQMYSRECDVDVYHINWLQCALPLPANGKPAVVSVLGNDLKLLTLPMVRGLIRRALRGRRVVICPNAEWMRESLQLAFGDMAEVAPVSFGIDPQWFAVQRQYDPAAPRRWLAVTRLTVDKLGSLFSWGERFFVEEGRELHLFGPMQERVDVPDWVTYHGSATPEQLCLNWFPSCCGLITLSRHAEGRPQVMLEAMASGLPIIASAMPAHGTLVIDRETGALCASEAELASALALLEDPETNARMGRAARDWALREVGTWDDCARRYVAIYRRLKEARHDE